MKQNNKSIPLTITKQYYDAECIYTLMKVIPNDDKIQKRGFKGIGIKHI